MGYARVPYHTISIVYSKQKFSLLHNNDDNNDNINDNNDNNINSNNNNNNDDDIHEKILESDWLRAVQFRCNTSTEGVKPVLVQITHRNSGL